MVDFLAGRGITACFPHGHGLGLELRDYPILVPDSGLSIADDCVAVPADLPLEPGMVVNLEVSIFLPGAGSLEVEITTLVTETGARPFVPQDRSTPVRPT
jgi:Xaa-Pro aminopeptidase